MPNECLHPIYIKKQGLFVPCGKCPCCRSKMRYDLSTRIYLETAFSGSSFFVTLTYNDDNLPRSESGALAFDKKQVQDFLKRVRRRLDSTRLRFFLTCEFGDGKEAQIYLQQYGQEYGRSHYHAIFICDIKRKIREMRDIVQASWTFGYSSVSTCSMARIQYATQYALKDEDYLYKEYQKDDPCKPFRLFSLKPGLGAGFGNDEKPIIGFLNGYLYNDGLHIRDRLQIAGKSRGVPRYYKDRIDPSVGEELKQKSLQYLQDQQEHMQEVKYSHSFVDCLGQRQTDYSIDLEILRKRRAIRQIRKSKNKTVH